MIEYTSARLVRKKHIHRNFWRATENNAKIIAKGAMYVIFILFIWLQTSDIYGKCL